MSIGNQVHQDASPGSTSPLSEEKVLPTAETDEVEYATGLKLFLIMLTILMSTSLAAIEIGIIATAIPGITDTFHRLNDVGWYGSVTFIMASAAPMWGKVYKYLDIKYAYLASIACYLVASIVGGTARNSNAVIVGRALQGLGACGTLGGSLLVINYVASPSKRPVLIGVWMGIFMISTIIGPLIGGAFTSGVSWRWCFYINLPLGGPIIALVLLFLKMPEHIRPAPATWMEILAQLDIPGFATFLASLVCLTLALQWGGQTKPWNDGSVIATFAVWIVLSIAFFAIEWAQGTKALIPFNLAKRRIIWSNALYCFILNATLFLIMFYLPIYFQSIHGQSAIISGVNTLPFLAFFALGAMTSGVVVGKTRLLQPYQLLSALLMTVGSALFYTLEVGSSKARYIGPQIIFGFGLGLGSQVPVTAVQAFSAHEDIPSATGIMIMCQAVGGAYFLDAAQSMFANRLLHTLKTASPGIDASIILSTGASDIRRSFAGDDLISVINAYMVGIHAVFIFAIASSALAVLLALLIPIKKLPIHGADQKDTATAS
ncbi:hypothetical protein HBI12_177270 [Parastagonospora nodorum]|nr:hypothetical protein HBI12_177270 [Parastagonospora nodorum]KAH5396581.1 hypothetical protein HBI47_222550 [Parastagonospora nodorum]